MFNTYIFVHLNLSFCYELTLVAIKISVAPSIINGNVIPLLTLITNSLIITKRVIIDFVQTEPILEKAYVQQVSML